jgi:hypothetical protein
MVETIKEKSDQVKKERLYNKKFAFKLVTRDPACASVHEQ